jgi:hypothetical protein
MPVGRFTLFASKFVAGWLMFVTPYVIHMAISLLIGKAKGAYTGESLLNALLSLGVRVVIFMVVYATSIMAVCLTGNIVISMIAVVVLNIYSIVLECMIENLFSDFLYSFTKYSYNGVWAFSPIAMIIKLYSEEPVSLYRVTISIYSYSYLPKLLLAIVVYTIIAAVLYMKRASESAGRAIAFKWAEPIVKTMCVIPVSLFSGMFFSSLISNDKSKVWYIFGMVFGYVIVALLMEVIFRMDIKGIFKHKKQFIFNAACVALIFVIFRYDVLGYNTFVPDDTELQSCSVWLGVLDGNSSGTLADGTTFSYGSAQYAFENMEIKGNPSVMELARKVCTNDAYAEDGNYTEQIFFAYNYINGKKCYRTYYVDINDEETMKLVADVFNDSDYKAGSSPILKYGELVEYDKLYCTGKYNAAEIELTPQLQAEIIAAYKQDYNNLTFDEVINTYPLGEIEMRAFDSEEYTYGTMRRYSYSEDMVIYPSYTNTLKVLNDNGFDMTYNITADDVKSISVSYYEVQERSDGFSTYNSYSNIYSDVKITDKEQIGIILDNIENQSFNWYSYTDFVESDDDDYYEIFIEYSDSENNANLSGAFEFRKGCVPEFVRELGE